MGRFRDPRTGVVVSVEDSKDDRFAVGYEPADAPVPVKKAAAKKAAAAVPGKK